MRAFGPVLALPALAFVLTSHSWATTASDICSPTQDPCHVTIPIVVTSGATLDFGTRGLIIDAPNGSLVSPGGSIVIYAGHVEIDGHIDVRGDTAGVVTLLASNAVTIGTSGQVLADGNSDGGVVSVVSQATVTVNGRLSAQATDADGCGGQITVSAAASCAIAGLLDSSAPQGDARIDAAGDYALSLHCAGISVTGQIQATGKTSGGFVILDSNRGSLTVGGPVDVSTSGANANSGTVVFTSANDIIVDSPASGPVIKGDVGETDITLVAGRDISILGKEIRGATIEVRAGYDMDGVNTRGLACFSPFVGALSDECQRWFGGVRLDGNTLLNAGSASDVESITVEGCNVFEGTQVQVKASTVVFAAREQLTVHGTVITDDDLTLSFRVSSPDTQGSCFKNYGKMCDSGSPFVEQDATLIACSCGQAVCDDHQQCTTDACDSARGCVQSPADGHPCNDGTACTTLGTCSGGVCFESHPVDCNDNLPCTLDSCDPARGCVHSPITGPCDDGNACTINDTCSAIGSCVGSPACGDHVIEPACGEQCDGSNVGGASCQSSGFSGGQLGCHANCTFDTSQCTICGNGRIEQGEVCDGANLGGASCQSQGFPEGGTLACATGCRFFDTRRCFVCGNGVIEADEECDGPDLGGAICDAPGETGGQPSCTDACRLDRSTCFFCGNGRVDPGEECDDGNDVLGDGCRPDCRTECGNGTVERNEECDDGNRSAGDGCSPQCAREAPFGGGGARQECAVEWGIEGGPADRRQECHDGDAVCDRGGVLGECAFQLFYCLNVADIVVGDPTVCRPTDVARVALRRASLTGPRALSASDLDSLLGAFRATLERGGAAVSRTESGLTAVPPVNGRRLCGSALIHVPLVQAAGRLVRGRRTLAIEVTDSAGLTDRDTLNFSCDP